MLILHRASSRRPIALPRPSHALRSKAAATWPRGIQSATAVVGVDGGDVHARAAAARGRGAACCATQRRRAADSCVSGDSAVASRPMLLPASSDATPAACHASVGCNAVSSAEPAQREQSRQAQRGGRGCSAVSAAQRRARVRQRREKARHAAPRQQKRKQTRRWRVASAARDSMRAAWNTLPRLLPPQLPPQVLFLKHTGRTARQVSVGRSVPLAPACRRDDARRRRDRPSSAPPSRACDTPARCRLALGVFRLRRLLLGDDHVSTGCERV